MGAEDDVSLLSYHPLPGLGVHDNYSGLPITLPPVQPIEFEEERVLIFSHGAAYGVFQDCVYFSWLCFDQGGNHL